jgi:hypothetical protein
MASYVLFINKIIFVYLVSFGFYCPSKCGSYFCRTLYYPNLEKVNSRTQPIERKLPELNSRNRNLKMKDFLGNILSK